MIILFSAMLFQNDSRISKRPTPNQSTSLIDQKILKSTNKKVKKLCLEIINAERKKDEYDK